MPVIPLASPLLPGRSMRAIALFAALEILGFALDAVWHGLVNPGFEATDMPEMARHLITVHLPLYLGVAGFFGSVAAAASRASWVALGGAAIQVVGEAWHAATHLLLAPHAAVPGMLSGVGFAIALVALAVTWRRRAATARRAAYR